MSHLQPKEARVCGVAVLVRSSPPDDGLQPKKRDVPERAK